MAKAEQHTHSLDAQGFLELVRTFHLPRYEEIPDIDLYMDQLLSYVEQHLRPLVAPDEKLLTASMVNNYVKQRIIAAPTAKRYGVEQVAMLIVVCLMKRVFSIDYINSLLVLSAKTHPSAQAYNFFCTTVEESLRKLFCLQVTRPDINSWVVANPAGFGFALQFDQAERMANEQRLAISAATAVANKIYVEKCFELGILEGSAV